MVCGIRQLASEPSSVRIDDVLGTQMTFFHRAELVSPQPESFEKSLGLGNFVARRRVPPAIDDDGRHPWGKVYSPKTESKAAPKLFLAPNS